MGRRESCTEWLSPAYSILHGHQLMRAKASSPASHGQHSLSPGEEATGCPCPEHLGDTCWWAGNSRAGRGVGGLRAPGGFRMGSWG